MPVRLPLAGPHFVENFLAAAAAAHVLGIPAAAMAEAARSLGAARHRGEVLRLGEDVVLLDDCYNSSPAALEAAVVTLGLLRGQRRVAVLGDMLELGPTGAFLHRDRGRSLRGRVDVVIGVGPLAKEIVTGAREAGIASAALHHFADATAAAAAVPGHRPSRRRRAGQGLARRRARGGRRRARRALRERGGLSPCSTTSSTRCAASSRR